MPALGVVGFIRVRGVHSCVPWGYSGLFGTFWRALRVVAFIRSRHGSRRVHSGSFGKFGFVGFIDARLVVVGFI